MKSEITVSILKCPKCGTTKTWNRITSQKKVRGFTLEWCPKCRWFRFYRIESTEKITSDK